MYMETRKKPNLLPTSEKAERRNYRLVILILVPQKILGQIIE